ncbi:MAG: threonylcarbamoyl-AMP synthase [Omnitrophica WOR_2 bacterium RIFCSPHIGHO2_02_FULL_68_15]|nr:MAG: threonylcarbamoyl-AMP synthase [Omnitrophica WOR_2 bacterium RIFCSPHIGHO2_02_FULL_68_15]
MSAVDPAVIAEAADCLRRGGLVIFPTETVYGVGVHADDAAAVARLYEAKARPVEKLLTLHVATVEAARQLPVEWSSAALELARRFWPGPLTLILPRRGAAGTVGIRVPRHPVAEALLSAAGVPVAASSANRSGQPAPTTAEAAVAALGEFVEVVVDAGPCAVGAPSTVVDCTVTPPVIRRAGALAQEIEQVWTP